MSEKKTSIARDAFWAVLALAFVLLLHGAVPFFATPTLQVALWTTGFSQSFINESIFSIYAKNFGAPEPAAIAFGLAGAWPTAILIKLGLHPADAYSGMAAFWLSLGFLSAYKIGRFFGAQYLMAILVAVFWMSMPIVWAHASYSMLSLGIGLLPLYFWAALNLFLSDHRLPKSSFLYAGMYAVAALIAVFMDGYSFMMFAVGASLLCAYIIIAFPDRRKHMFLVGIPVHVLSFGLAYFLYVLYIGKPEFESSPIDLFRAYGLDLSFVVIPTQGIHWVFDILGLSRARSDNLYFGDDSVWVTTFCLPIVLAGLFSWWRIRQHTKIASGLLLLAAFGFYMAMGPSLKINSTKPEAMQQAKPKIQFAMMLPEMAVAPTGSAWISENLPGFKSMRATYRWSALGIFGLWMLFVLLIGKNQPKCNIVAGGVLIGLIGLNLPNLSQHWASQVAFRKMFFDIDTELVASLEKYLHRDEMVSFLPFGNDFLVTYMAPALGIRTYNTGGDKNLNEAHKHWPITMKKFKGNQLEEKNIDDISQLLLRGDSDVVVIPYFDKLWSAHSWPCIKEAACPSQQRNQQLSSIIHNLKQDVYLAVTDSNLFATVRLRPEFSTATGMEKIKNKFLVGIKYPILITPNVNGINFVLNDGWYAVEPTYVWSSAFSTIILPVPDACQEKKCAALLKFGVFGASQQRPVSVKFSAKDRGVNWNQTIVATGAGTYEISVPLQRGLPSRVFSIEAPDAVSPMALSASPDGRILGISLKRIDLQLRN